jgi:hypothetical protein
MKKLLLFPVTGIILFLFLQGNPKKLVDAPVELATDSVYNFPGLLNLLKDIQLTPEAFKYAYEGYQLLETGKLLHNDSIITIIDYSKPSNEDRFYVIDLKHKSLVCKSLVAHGRNSGEVYAESFSNGIQSHKSSLGLFIASDTYTGSNGYSLHLDGMEKGLNDNARERAVVIHGANYVSESFIAQNGRIGRSFGCPALPPNVSDSIIDLIKGGSCLYIYHPQIRVKLLASAETTR